MAIDLNRLEVRIGAAFFARWRLVAPLLAVGLLVLLMDRRPAVVLSIDAVLFQQAPSRYYSACASRATSISARLPR